MLEDTTKDKILVIKHGALGDIIQGFDAFASLRVGHQRAHITLMTSPAFSTFAKMMPWFDEVIVDPRASVFNLCASLRVRRNIRRDWSIIVDMQCSARTERYFLYFRLPSTRWVGTASRCSDPLPDLFGLNNRNRMIKAAEIAGGIFQTADMEWLLADKDHSGITQNINSAAVYAVLVPGCSLAKPQKSRETTTEPHMLASR